MTISDMFKQYEFHDSTVLLPREMPKDAVQICFLLAAYWQPPEVQEHIPEGKELVLQATFYGCSSMTVTRSEYVLDEAEKTKPVAARGRKGRRSASPSGKWVDKPIAYAELDREACDDVSVLLDPAGTILSITQIRYPVMESLSFSAENVDIDVSYMTLEEERPLWEAYSYEL